MQLFKLMYRASVQEMNKFDDMMAYLKRSLREQGQAHKLPKFSQGLDGLMASVCTYQPSRDGTSYSQTSLQLSVRLSGVAMDHV